MPNDLATLPDNDLIARIRSGDTASSGAALLARYSQLALFVALAILSSAGKAARAAAEEVAWDGLTKALCALARFDISGSFPGWLTVIVRNTARDWLRAARRHRHAQLDGL